MIESENKQEKIILNLKNICDYLILYLKVVL